MKTQHELAQEVLAARDQLVKAEKELDAALEHRVVFDVTWSVTPVFVRTEPKDSA